MVGVDPGARDRFIRQRGCVVETGSDLIQQGREPFAFRPAVGCAEKPFDGGIDGLKQNLAHGLRVVLGSPGPQAILLFGGQL